MIDKLFIAHIDEITELLQLLVETDPVLLQDLNNVELGSNVLKNTLRKAVNEVSDPKFKKEFQNRLNNADNSKKIELVNRYGPIFLSSRIVRGVIGSKTKKKKKPLADLFTISYLFFSLSSLTNTL